MTSKCNGYEFAGTPELINAFKRLESTFNRMGEPRLEDCLTLLGDSVRAETKPSHRGINRDKFNLLIGYAFALGAIKERSADLNRYDEDQEITYAREICSAIDYLLEMDKSLRERSVQDIVDYFTREVDSHRTSEPVDDRIDRRKNWRFSRLYDLTKLGSEQLMFAGSSIANCVQGIDNPNESDNPNLPAEQREGIVARRLLYIGHTLTDRLKAQYDTTNSRYRK